MRYSHLVLQDYLGTKIPDPSVACPEDADQLRWGLDPDGYFTGVILDFRVDDAGQSVEE